MAYTHFSQVINEQVKKYGERVAMRYRQAPGQWNDISWKELGETSNAVASSLINDGIGVQDTVGIFSQNMPEWTMADFSALLINAIPVPVYPTNTADQTEYIVNDAEISILFAGDEEQYKKALQIIDANKYLKKIVVFKKSVAIEKSDRVIYWDDYIAAGRANPQNEEIQRRQSEGKAEDFLTFIYTSGTTGEPKGVMLDHSNAISQMAAHDDRLIDPNDKDESLAFLPLSHVFERIWTYYAMGSGMVNNYMEDPAQVVDIIQEVKPTIMCAVPRFYEKIYAAVYNQLESASPVKKTLFNWAVETGRTRNNLKKDQKFVNPLLAIKYALADKLVLKKLRALTGGRIKFFPCAGAPLAQEIEEFFYAIGIFIAYGYGLTETTATATVHEQYNFKFGAVGKPLKGVEIKIDESNGEILIRGANVMRGYYKKPEATSAVLIEDGWFRTGDVGYFEENGELRITDRIKDLMKTSGGKYIAPQLIETAMLSIHYIEKIAVIGDQRKFVSALIVPNFVNLEEYAKVKGFEYSDKEELITNPDIVKLYQDKIDEANKGLANFEKVKKFRLLNVEFTVEGGEITPTQKVKRKVVAEKYKSEIDSMYQE